MKTDRVRKCQLTVMLFLMIASAFALPLTAGAGPLPAPAGKPVRAETLTQNIGAESDDVDQYLGGVILDNPTLVFGNDGTGSHHVGLRFTDITIPQGAAIQEAHVMLTAVSGSSASPLLTFRGHAAPDSPTFSPGDGPLNRQDQATISSVSWSPTSWAAGGLYNSPDLSSIIQEIVARADWNAGNALSLMIYDDSWLGQGFLEAVSWEGQDTEARLTITYSDSPAIADFINPNLFAFQEYEFIGYPDLVVTDVFTNQDGYPLFDTYTVSAEITNMGGADSGPFEVVGQIGRHHNGGGAITWGLGDCAAVFDPQYGCELSADASFSIDSVSNLAPGESILLNSGLRSLTTDVFEDEGSASAWNGPPFPYTVNIPRYGQVFVKAEIVPPANEHSTSNNASVTSFIYPNNPASYVGFYIPDQDDDGDGFYGEPFGQDCDDENPFIHPDMWEIPDNGIDDNCDGIDQWSSYSDIPGWDLWCDTESPSESDADNDGWSADEGDCNPCDILIHPGAAETLNGLDDDCDQTVDEGFSIGGKSGDADGDGWANDCDELHGWINPGANEIPDGIDNDCDGYVDEGYLTPDWTITSFELERRNDNCVYHPNQYMGSDPPPLCGIQAEYEVANLGDVLSPSELVYIRNQIRLLDIGGNEYPAFSPYIAFPSQAYAEEMACANTGLIASIPGGILGEENTTNNLSIFYLNERDRDLDIVHTDMNLYYAESRLPTLERDLFRITGFGGVEGSCPPPTFFWNYSIQVKVFVEGGQVFVGNYVELQVPPHNVLPIIDSGLRLTFPQRPGNNDAIRVEVLLNGDERYDEDSSNNLCVVHLTYIRNNWPIGALFDSDVSFSTNDELHFVSKEGSCATVLVHHGGTITAALTGAPTIQLGFVLGLVVLLGVGLAGGGLLGGQIAQRFAVAGAGRVLSSIAGALLGGAVLIGAAIGIASIGGTPEVDLTTPPRSYEPTSDNLSGLLLESDDPQVILCDEIVASSMEAIMTDAGALEDVQLQLQVTEGSVVPADSNFRVTLWDSEGSPLAALTTEETSLSLASEGILPEIGSTIFWQVVVEGPDPSGGDQDAPICLPMIQAFNVGGATEEVVIDLPDEPELIITPPDTAAPVVSGMSADPNPTLTTVPVTVSATIIDETGIAGVDLYYLVSKGAVQYGGAMLHYGGNLYSIQIGPLVPAGTYNYYILAVDTLGNATCTVASIGECPGGSFVVNIP